MRLLDAIDAAPRQMLNLITDKGERAKLELFYLPSQQAWFFNLTYSALAINGARLVCGPNVLRNYRNRLPFGLACLAADLRDPAYLTDFTDGRAQLYLLSVADVALIEAGVGT